MAISFIAVANKATAAGTAGNLTVNVPVGTQNNDVMVAFINARGTSTQVLTPPAGWTTIGIFGRGGSGTSTSAGGNGVGGAYYRIANSEPANYAWTILNGTNLSGHIVTYRGVNLSSPINAYNAVNDTVNSNISTPIVTTTVANTQLVMAGIAASSTGSDSLTWTSGTTVDFVSSGLGSAGYAYSGVVSDVVVTAQTTNPYIATRVNPGSYVAFTVALAPSTGGPFPPSAPANSLLLSGVGR
jgi:hypothetical protein